MPTLVVGHETTQYRGSSYCLRGAKGRKTTENKRATATKAGK